MPVTAPTSEQLKQIASEMGLSLTESDVASFIALMRPNVDAYNVLDQIPDNLPQVKYPRTPGYRPLPEENKHNAWYYKTRVEGASQGKLKGKTLVLKDNVMLAGVPMMNGASTLEGYTPDVDATIVTRILDAGGTILGKAHCECFCLSGGSHTNATGPVHNPHKMGYSAGGSSSGSAVLVALGEADMAIGGDQGGSIRMPSSFCGIYGMKPTTRPGLPSQVAPARQRAVGDHEALHPVRHLCPQAPRESVLRQGDEHHPAADRGLRRGPRAARPAPDAHDADEGATDAEAGRGAGGDHRPGARDDHEYRALRHLPPSRDGDPLRDERWATGQQ